MKTRWPIFISVSEIEKEFLLAAVHLKQIVLLDGIDLVTKPPGFLLRSYDLHGPLPDVIVRDTADRTEILDEISREAAKLNAIARHWEELGCHVPGLPFPAGIPYSITRWPSGCRPANGRSSRKRRRSGGPTGISGEGHGGSCCDPPRGHFLFAYFLPIFTHTDAKTGKETLHSLAASCITSNWTIMT